MTNENFDESTGRSEQSRLVPKSPRVAIEPEQTPPPPQRASQKKSPFVTFLSAFLSLILVLCLLGVAAYAFLQERLNTAGPLENDLILTIPNRSGMPEIAKLLHNNGVIDDPMIFQVGVVAKEARGKLKAGEYIFPKQVSQAEVIDILRDGKAFLHPITLPEGLTTQQIIERLNAADVLTGEIKTKPAEGTILPDTYKVQRGTSREALLSRMMQEHKKLISQLWAQKPSDSPLKKIEDISILASIVEKETGKADERPRVAAVFLNRLKKGMRLQSDPTIIYGIVGGQGPLNRAITRSDIDTPTPYNTYTIDGLPPTPIANPGRESLEAVINPARTNDLFFVADGTGGHAFAETLDEHNRNVAKWREIERNKGAPMPTPKAEPAPQSPKAPNQPENPALNLRLR